MSACLIFEYTITKQHILVINELFLDQILQRIVLVSHFRIHPLVLAQLDLRLFETFQLRCTHATELRPPVVIRRITDAVTPANILDLGACLGFFEDRNDLVLIKSTAFICVSCQWYPARKLQFRLVSVQGKLTVAVSLRATSTRASSKDTT